MNTQDIVDVLEVSRITGNLVSDNISEPEAISALIDWKNQGQVTVELVNLPDSPPSAKVKRGKLTESTDSEPKFEATPDPSADDPGF